MREMKSILALPPLFYGQKGAGSSLEPLSAARARRTTGARTPADTPPHGAVAAPDEDAVIRGRGDGEVSGEQRIPQTMSMNCIVNPYLRRTLFQDTFESLFEG